MTAVLSGLRAEVTDDDLVRMSVRNPGWKFERSDGGDVLVSPTSTNGGAKSGEAHGQLYVFSKRVGGKSYDSSTGFKTPGGGVVSPDAAWVRPERVAAMNDETYQSVTPDVVVEVASSSDDWNAVMAKVDKYAADGAGYAIAIDPSSRAVYERGERPAGLELDVDAIIDA